MIGDRELNPRGGHIDGPEGAGSRAPREPPGRVWSLVAIIRPHTPLKSSYRARSGSTSACEWPERVAQVRTRRTALPDQPAADPSLLPFSRPRDGMNQRTPSASTEEFFNTIRAKRSFVKFSIS